MPARPRPARAAPRPRTTRSSSSSPIASTLSNANSPREGPWRPPSGDAERQGERLGEGRPPLEERPEPHERPRSREGDDAREPSAPAVTGDEAALVERTLDDAHLVAALGEAEDLDLRLPLV